MEPFDPIQVARGRDAERHNLAEESACGRPVGGNAEQICGRKQYLAHQVQRYQGHRCAGTENLARGRRIAKEMEFAYRPRIAWLSISAADANDAPQELRC